MDGASPGYEFLESCLLRYGRGKAIPFIAVREGAMRVAPKFAAMRFEMASVLAFEVARALLHAPSNIEDTVLTSMGDAIRVNTPSNTRIDSSARRRRRYYYARSP